MIVGLTGQTGAGKSTVSAMLCEAGVDVIDCDQVARQVVTKGSACLTELAMAFSSIILDSRGCLNRKMLGSIAFGDPKKLKMLNRIIYPHILQELNSQIEALKNLGKQVIVLDAPTLFEAGVDRMCDLIVSVTSDELQRLERIMKRDALTSDEAYKRMNAQYSEEFFVEHSDIVIRNNVGEEQLRGQVSDLLLRIEQDI